ncbi:hypothetical protein ANN_06718 [Periplaneta americana]|uniref:Uncharacterized protein n=1 Tax=Periplaneta americana TaxID=6978 RepID=A0ABQ8TG75_PERAM|nr:hypothetical protein ANN_06718 [Periplaneta americana]
MYQLVPSVTGLMDGIPPLPHCHNNRDEGIPSHHGIAGNEAADFLAKKGTTIPLSYLNMLPIEHRQNNIRSRVRQCFFKSLEEQIKDKHWKDELNSPLSEWPRREAVETFRTAYARGTKETLVMHIPSQFDSKITSSVQLSRQMGRRGKETSKEERATIILLHNQCKTLGEMSTIVNRMKHGGGGVLVWRCMSSAGMGLLAFIEGNMDHQRYIDILKGHVVPSAKELGIRDNFIFMKYNDPKNTAHNTRLWILYNIPLYLQTPPQSSDINPIQHLWHYLERRLRTRHITNKESLKVAIIEEWNNIPANCYTKKFSRFIAIIVCPTRDRFLWRHFFPHMGETTSADRMQNLLKEDKRKYESYKEREERRIKDSRKK